MRATRPDSQFFKPQNEPKPIAWGHIVPEQKSSLHPLQISWHWDHLLMTLAQEANMVDRRRALIMEFLQLSNMSGIFPLKHMPLEAQDSSKSREFQFRSTRLKGKLWMFSKGIDSNSSLVRQPEARVWKASQIQLIMDEASFQGRLLRLTS